eukprot:TRINITY_DN39698_c0_g1_i2.p1 TRINITY_DN39698_c0_g1~~TRINITY_DN39698_c0_g1_i2.p1  ORF type:complete len:234 (+),score=24.51 TRINITY_DN39698_c0_g1_i2:628-1329(+)
MWSFLALAIDVGLGNLELLDFFTDGQQVAQAYLCDEEFHAKWVASFDKSWLPGFVTMLVDKAHMYGLMMVSLVAAAIVSCLFVRFSRSSNMEEEFAVLSSMAGVGGYACMLHAETARVKSVLRLASVSLFETLPGVYLQTSLFSLTFDHTSEKTKHKQLLSLALGAGALFKNVVDGVEHPVRNRKTVRAQGVAVVLLPFLMIVGSLAVCTARVYFSYACPSHIWNLTSGCVSA